MNWVPTRWIAKAWSTGHRRRLGLGCGQRPSAVRPATADAPGLAKSLGIDLTTVTRAYTEAQRRGLTEARVGQAPFVAEDQALIRHGSAARPELDLSINLPPQPELVRALRILAGALKSSAVATGVMTGYSKR